MPRKEVYAQYKEASIAYSHKWRANNKKKHGQYSKAYRQTHLDQTRAYFRDYSKANPENGRTDSAKRRSVKLQALPKWLTKADRARIKTIYTNCPPGYEVDHIIPLQGKDVRGLHVPWNLQYLLMNANRVKGNKVLCA